MPLSEMFEGDWYLLQAFIVGAALLVAVLLSLAASALYAILSLAVSQRSREIGIRVALGASRYRIARDIAARAVVQIGAGVLLGLPFAGALCYEFLELTGSGRSVPGADRNGVRAWRVGHAACLTHRLHSADTARLEDRADGRDPCGRLASSRLTTVRGHVRVNPRTEVGRVCRGGIVGKYGDDRCPS